jgi:hypothetical protein
MRMNFKVLVAAVGVVGMAAQAQAAPILITPDLVDCTPVVEPACLVGTGDETGNNDVLAAVQALIGPTVFGYKYDVATEDDPAEESGPGAEEYETTVNGDLSGAVISWVGPEFFNTNPIYLIVKDGNHDPAWYLFRIAVGGVGNWDGQDDITLSGFWPGGGSISHLEIRGGLGTEQFCTTPGGCETVPDGGSATILLGMGLLGLAALRRRMGRI